MSRLGYLARNPKRTLGALGTLLAAAGLAVGSGAYFTDTDTSIANSATAAEFGITVIGSATPSFDAFSCNDATGAKCHDDALDSDPAANADDTVFRIARLVPNTSRTYSRRFALRNDGNVPAQVRVWSSDHDDAPLLGALKTTAAAVTSGATSLGLSDGNITDLNKVVTVPANTTWTYELTFEFPDSGSDQTALAGTTANVKLNALAVDTNAPEPQIP